MLLDYTQSSMSTYTADCSGVASALYELGGMTVIHDASGCNSTYTTHDEPRWNTMPSAVFISALTGQRVQKLFELIRFVYEQNSIRISTGRLNEVLAEATARVQPPTDKGKRLKVLYMTQVSTKPPTFVIFCNRAELFHFSYRRYLENQIREVFGLTGTPVRFIIREREKEK